jgi:hypothetical protein
MDGFDRIRWNITYGKEVLAWAKDNLRLIDSFPPEPPSKGITKISSASMNSGNTAQFTPAKSSVEKSPQSSATIHRKVKAPHPK